MMAPVLRSWMCLFLSCVMLHTGFLSVQSCGEVGWFGSNCQYKCHCVNSSCDVQGKCTNGSKCERGWFGPACQYQDWVIKARVMTLPHQDKDLILDDDDTSCHDNLQVVIFTWSINYPLSWMRIHVSEADPEDLRNLTVLLKPHKTYDTEFTNNPYINCDRKRTSFINALTVDVHCDVRESVHEILLYGNGMRTMCGLHVNGGRNVALKQAAWQSSTLKSEIAVASRAVDGGWLGQFRDNSCTHTDLSDTTPEWGITFSLPVNINRFEILNRNDCCQRRLMHFSFSTYSAQNTLVHHYSDTKLIPQNSYTVVSLESKAPVKRFNVSAHNKWQDSVVLTLCEVELYGDPACQSGKFGFECNDTCNCAIPGAECFVSTGACASGCAAGYHGDGCKEVCPPHLWGVDCLSRCSEQCAESRCDSVTGRCLGGCQLGYKGPDCTKVCDAGNFGANCTEVCPVNCTNGTCDHVNGSCVCKTGFHGSDCALLCSELCLNGTCDHVTGQCSRCVSGYWRVKGDEGDVASKNSSCAKVKPSDLSSEPHTDGHGSNWLIYLILVSSIVGNAVLVIVYIAFPRFKPKWKIDRAAAAVGEEKQKARGEGESGSEEAMRLNDKVSYKEVH